MSDPLRKTFEPLVRRRLFSTEEEAAQTLVREYVLRQIAKLERGIAQFEQKYAMRFEQFEQYLQERSKILETTPYLFQQKSLGEAVMREEDDWLEWKARLAALDSWLGLQQEIHA